MIYNKHFFLATFLMLVLLFFSIDLAFVFYGFYFFMTFAYWKYKYKKIYSDKANWLTATIVKTSIGKECGPMIKLKWRFSDCIYWPIIRYEYEKDGQKHISDRVSVFPRDHVAFPEKRVKEFLQKYPVGKSINIYLDSDKQASIVQEMSDNVKSFLNTQITLAVIILFVFVFMQIG